MTGDVGDAGGTSGEGASAFDSLPTADLIGHLATCGLEVPPGLPGAILRKPDATSGLVDLVRLARHWYRSGPGGGWAPIHALALLAARRDPEGLEALLVVMRFHPEDLGDYLTDVVPSWLLAFGPPSLPHLEAMLRDEILDPFVRMVAASALICHARVDPGLAPRIKEVLLQEAIETPNRKVSASIGIDLVELRDPALKAPLRTLFTMRKITEDEMGWKEAEDVYDGRLEPILAEIVDPMDHFHPDNLRALKDVQEVDRLFRARLAQWGLPDRTGGPWRLRPKIPPKVPIGGADRPCPCGSGKFLRECHGEP